MKKTIPKLICLMLIVMLLAVPALAAASDYTVTVSTDTGSVKPGDIVTVNVAVSGAQFCGAQMELSYDTDRFTYISTMSGWSENEDGKLGFLNVNGSGGYWEDGKILGTFKFMVKESASAGDAIFCIGQNSDVFIVGDWMEGTSSDPAVPLEKEQLIGATVTVQNGGNTTAEASDYGAVGDDGSTLNMEAGHSVYTIPDTDNDQVIWKTEDEKVASVDEAGLVTAVSDGSTVLTAVDENGNTLEQRTIIVGDIPAQQETETTPEPTKETTASEEQASEPKEDTDISISDEQEPAEPETAKSAKPHLWIAVAALVVIVVAIAVVVVRKKTCEMILKACHLSGKNETQQKQNTDSIPIRSRMI